MITIIRYSELVLHFISKDYCHYEFHSILSISPYFPRIPCWYRIFFPFCPVELRRPRYIPSKIPVSPFIDDSMFVISTGPWIPGVSLIINGASTLNDLPLIYHIWVGQKRTFSEQHVDTLVKHEPGPLVFNHEFPRATPNGRPAVTSVESIPEGRSWRKVVTFQPF